MAKIVNQHVKTFTTGQELKAVELQAWLNQKNANVAGINAHDHWGEGQQVDHAHLLNVDAATGHDARYYTRGVADSRFVNAAGDTMAGFLTLHANPTANLHAATKGYVDNRRVTYMTVPHAIVVNGGIRSEVTGSGNLNTTLTIDISELVPEGTNSILLTLTTQFRATDDRHSWQDYYAWKSLPWISHRAIHSGYLVLRVEGGKLWQTGGEGDFDYVSGTNSFSIPLRSNRTFQLARRQAQINEDRGHFLALIGYH